jgi:hypothetical protein
MVHLQVVCSQQIYLALFLPMSILQTDQNEGGTGNPYEGKLCSIGYNLRLQ